MPTLSVNVNKIATLRNSRGGDIPNLLKVVADCESFGAQGITVHPRPDERHITYRDVYDLKDQVKTEYNIEGNPISKFIDLVLDVKPTQVTLVPDEENAITSNSGWDTVSNKSFLTEVISELKKNNIRTSVFVYPNEKDIEGAALTGADRIELYTEQYAKNYQNKDIVIKPYIQAARIANKLGLGVNAGHDLNIDNLNFFSKNIPQLLEVSIGHSLISDSIYNGLENTIKMYLTQLY
ncbi:pyridoxine 5'-phosphate synthase [Ichthyobacterium seriolicida]|uniref:Pyridoxine 5'-phosphate synthase n=1 Tax=Ichthyobacterium seriolicida TaxID=242600 RepID=A0A1J1ECG4_9FLAO|nr:pyridoxine 5'-phosphate synthase [Ichthyobacterium seriolicida]BAV95200.1 pyridoxine 5'-phosphate synthase [Ichthyobacterium seriolicida]